MAWKIDRDYINGTVDDICHLPSRVGSEGAITVDGDPLPSDGERVRFRIKDDDGEVYYGGWLNDDEECANQLSALSYGTWDAGATEIEVKRDGKWVQDIG
jgi:hypothetical protein